MVYNISRNRDMPTFPTSEENVGDGISLRDYIAVAALRGLLSSGKTLILNPQLWSR